MQAVESLHKRLENSLGMGNQEEDSINEYSNLFDEKSLFIMSGGGYISGGWDSQIFARIKEIQIAKERGAKCYVIGQSIGPIYNDGLRKTLVKALNMCDKLSVRDNTSRDYLIKNGVKKEIEY